MLIVSVDVSLRIVPKNWWPAPDSTASGVDQVAPSSLEKLKATSTFEQTGAAKLGEPMIEWQRSYTRNVVTVVPSASRRLSCLGNRKSWNPLSPGANKPVTLVLVVVTRVGVEHRGAFGAPCGWQVTNLISTGFGWLPNGLV